MSGVHGALTGASAALIGWGANDLTGSGLLAVGIALGVILLMGTLWFGLMEKS